jgi:hypothetical protein
MSDRITRADANAATYWLEREAKRLELLPKDAHLVFSPGSVTQGHSPEVTAFYKEPASNGRQTVRVHFLPAFTCKTTLKAAWELLNATARGLAAVPTREEPVMCNECIEYNDRQV